MRKFCGWLLLMFVVGGIGMTGAQEMAPWLKEAGVPPPPAERVVDEEGFLSQAPGALQKMRTAVQRLEQKHGFKIYVVIRSVLLDTSAQTVAGQYQQAWVPNGNGLVLVYETNSRSLGLGRGYEGDLGAPGQDAVIPSHEMVDIIRTVMEQTDRKLKQDEYLEALTLELTEKCQSYFQRRADPLPGGRGMRMVALTLGAISVVTLLALLLGQLLRRSGAHAPGRFVFPKSDLPQRLGAPFGGGKVTVHRFGPKA